MATPKSNTGIKVIVVGAGFGGLTTAIECHRQGHDVVVYEKFPELKVLGDGLGLGSNAGRIIHRWGKHPGEVADRIRPLCFDGTDYGFRYHKYDTGELLFEQEDQEKVPGAPAFAGHRGEIHQVIFEHARDDLGIPIHLGQDVREYFEDDDQAGIVLKSGERVVADVVVGADGVRSKARELVLGYEDKPRSSGYAIWRAWFKGDEMMKDPRTKGFGEHRSTFDCWFGPDVHFIFTTKDKGTDCCWVLTHKDEHDIDESWSFPGKLEEVLELLKGWDPVCSAIVEKTPFLVDWKLVYRDPLPTWVSGKGRTLLLGDAAHPFLPTSVQGASQAVEDGATIAACLRLAGKEHVQAALRTHQEIRYERVKLIQKTGETTRDMWHKADWAKVKEDPKSIALPREDWIHAHDAEAHVEAVFEEISNKYT